MKFKIELTDSQLKVFSAIFSNLSAAWIIVIFATKDILALILNIVAAILSLYLSIKTEDLRKEYDWLNSTNYSGSNCLLFSSDSNISCLYCLCKKAPQKQKVIFSGCQFKNIPNTTFQPRQLAHFSARVEICSKIWVGKNCQSNKKPPYKFS